MYRLSKMMRSEERSGPIKEKQVGESKDRRNKSYFVVKMLYSAVLVTICAVFIASQVVPSNLNHQTESTSDFPSELFNECSQSRPGENVIISPLSVASALALLSQGAAGNTFTQLTNGLGLPSDKTTAADQLRHHYNLLQKNVGKATLSIANQIYMQQGYQVNKDFHDVAVEKFSSGIESLNFEEAELSAEIINKFVENKTNNKIKDLIHPDMLSPGTRLVLVNAVHFKGSWRYQFDKELTTEGNFYATETETHSADFMNMMGDFNYARLNDLDATALEMKYENSSLTILIVLPNDRNGLSALETKLKSCSTFTITEQLCFEEEIDVTIPKFKVVFNIELNGILAEMGMKEMFTHRANLTGILDTNHPLHVSKVVHKAFIEVNEEGAEAAAATTAGIVMMSMAGPPPKWIRFLADHPFVYYVRDTETNTNLFSGSVKHF